MLLYMHSTSSYQALDKVDTQAYHQVCETPSDGLQLSVGEQMHGFEVLQYWLQVALQGNVGRYAPTALACEHASQPPRLTAEALKCLHDFTCRPNEA